MSENETCPRVSGRLAFAILAVLFLAGLAVRLAYWYALRGSDVRVLLTLESMDSMVYHNWASAIAGGDLLLGDQPFNLSPFYSYLLAPIYALAGNEMFTAILVQLLLGAAGIVWMYVAGALVFNRMVGLLAAGLTAFYGQYVLTEGLLLSEAFIPFLTAAFIVTTAWALKRNRPGLLFVSGLILGALFSLRPQYFAVVLLLPLLGLFFPFWKDRWNRYGLKSRKEVMKRIALGALGAALMVTPLALRNLVVTGEPILLTTQGGMNFYIGNHPEATGTWRVPEGFRGSHTGMCEDFAEAARKADPEANVSRYWFKKGFRYVADNPGHWVRLMLRKAAVFFNNYEVPVNFHFALFRDSLPVLAFAFIPFCVVGSLGLLGIAMAFRRKEAGWLMAVTAGCFFGTVLFFISARYRVVAVPYLILFAAYALVKLLCLVRQKAWGRLVPCGLVLALSLVLTLWRFPTGVYVSPASAADQVHMVAVHFLRSGDKAKGERWIRKAIEVHPDNPLMWWDLGMLCFESDRLEEAEACIRRAIQGMPDNSKLWGVLCNILLKAGRKEEAAQALQKSIELAGRR